MSNAYEAAVRLAYTSGFCDGLKCFAHWKDGVQYVGTTGMTLNEAVSNAQRLHGFSITVKLMEKVQADLAAAQPCALPSVSLRGERR